jgi:ABC-type multidrug transport system permease subunit
VDPLNDLATFILGRIKEGLYAQWLKFLFELGFSAVVSFLFICGGTLAATHEASAAIGSGMVMAGISMTVLFRRERSRLTKGMLVVLPSAEAAQELATDLQTIEKPDKEK